MAELSVLDISFTLMLVVPVMVTTSSTTEVVMLFPPANFSISAVFMVLPVLSSPTKVNPVKPLRSVKLSVPDPLVTRTWLAVPSAAG